MRALFKLILWLSFVTPLALAAAVWFGLSEQALVAQQTQLSDRDIADARALLKKYDPRSLPADTRHQIILSQRKLNVALNYLLQKTASGAAKVAIEERLLSAQITLSVPGLSHRQFLNIQAELQQTEHLPQINSLTLGALKLPPELAEPVLQMGLKRLLSNIGLHAAGDVIQNVTLQPKRLQLTYLWDPGWVGQARSALIDQVDQQALLAHQQKLLEWQQRGVGIKGSLAPILQQLFAYAQHRSQRNDPVAENRAVLTLLGLWSMGQDLSNWLPQAKHLPPFRLTLSRRTDLAQHFLTSAALAASAGSKLADAVGLYKEIIDSDGGSGFSFTDIAADRAGARFGERVIQSNKSANSLQRLLAAGIKESDFMPAINDLPEHLDKQQFAQQFGDLGSQAYDNLMQDIEQRISACRLHIIE